MFFSIIVASFNAGQKLHKTVESILTQTYTDVEVIVKDAGSTDGSVDQLKHDERIRLVVSPDKGIYDGMNQAIAQARGQVIYFLNCGDTLHDQEVLRRVHDAAVSGAQVLSSTIWYGDVMEMQTGQRVAANPAMTHFAMFRYLPCHQACFYTRDLFKDRAFHADIKVRADYEHFLWSVIEAGARTCALPMVIADYEGGGFSETEEGRNLSRAEHKEICRKYFTAGERFWFQAYLIVSLQPLREKLAQSRYTAALYDAVKNFIYRK